MSREWLAFESLYRPSTKRWAVMYNGLVLDQTWTHWGARRALRRWSRFIDQARPLIIDRTRP